MKLAIDVVLLPSKEIIDLAIKINKTDPFGRILARNDWIPHISLFMGLIEEQDIEKISKAIEDIVKEFPPLDLEITEVTYYGEKEGMKNHGFKIKNIPKIQKIHEKLMEQLKEFLTTKAISENFVGEGASPEYINGFEEKSSFENFSPHITLRTHEVQYDSFPISFTSSEIALFHMGKNNTCRKLLFKKELKN